MSGTEQKLCISVPKLLKGCKSVKTVKQVHAFVLKTGLETDPLVCGKLLLNCAVTISGAALDYARHFLFHLQNPDVFMYNTLIRGLADSEIPQNALITFTEMCQKSMILDSFTFAFVLKAVANFRSLTAGIQLHCHALIRGLDTHLFIGTTLINTYAECKRLDYAKKVFDEMFEPNAVAWNAMLTACVRCGDLEGGKTFFQKMPIWNMTSWNIMLAGYMKASELKLAKEVFLRMPMKDDVSWSTMIVGFAQNGCFDDAFRFFREFVCTGIRPNETGLTGILSACAQAGAFELGKVVHGFIEKLGLQRILSVNNALMDTYGKCGNLIMARSVFERIPVKKSIVSWTIMIAAFAMHGCGEEAIQLFHKMESYGTIPDGISFISILYACSHAGLIEEGRQYFFKMMDYGIKPTIEHYGCMIDLYGRAGQLQKAYEFACKMPLLPNAIIWRTLLGACSIHGNVKLAEKVKERLVELDPKNCSDYILLSNVYAVAGKWKDVAALRRSMTEQKVQKTPGWSMIVVDKMIYSFMAGEKQDEITKEAYEKLREIMLKLRIEGGYVPEVGNVLYDIEEEEKIDSVTKHSEKLAVAFGIARLGEGKIIRIVKNLRICIDCHRVMKLISNVYRLEIVVRDRSRFHCFQYGFCSCKDYW